MCCLEGHCSAVSGTGEDLAGLLCLVGPSYFKKDVVEENPEKAKKPRALENDPLKIWKDMVIFSPHINNINMGGKT